MFELFVLKGRFMLFFFFNCEPESTDFYNLLLQFLEINLPTLLQKYSRHIWGKKIDKVQRGIVKYLKGLYIHCITV